jgi:Ca2+-binding RTX toxin-like protein
MVDVTFHRPFEVGSEVGPFQFVIENLNNDIGMVIYTGPNGFEGIYRIRDLEFVERPFDPLDRFDVLSGTIVGYQQFANGVLDFELSSFKLDAITVIENPPVETNAFINLFYGGADRFFGSSGNDTLFGYDGRDRIQGKRGDDHAFGGQGRDVLFGQSGADVLYGEAGNDRLLGGGQSDTLIGGSGADTLQGNEGRDTLQGGADNDKLFGNAGNDRLVGGGGRDVLRGGAGADWMQGGRGNDTYFIDNVGDRLFENSRGGLDDVNTSLLSFTLGSGFENLALTGSSVEGNIRTGSGNSGDNQILGAERNQNLLVGGAGNDTLVGGAQNDTLRGERGHDILEGGRGEDSLVGGFGDDQLEGGQGDDTLDGGDGSDTLLGGLGNDTYLIYNENDVIQEGVNQGLDEIHSLALAVTLADNVENLTLLGASREGDLITGVGNTLDNEITGSDFARNALLGAQGNDTLIGGNLADVLRGEDGMDWLAGGAGNDLLQGAEGNDVIVAGDGDDTLNGGVGHDTMSGGIGNDFYIVDSANDTLSENADSGTDTVQTDLVSFSLGENFENLVLTGPAEPDGILVGNGNALGNSITGSTLDQNHLFGGEGDDVIVAGDRDDTLDGGAGHDTMSGGIGNDFYIVDSANDTLSENADSGTDTVQTDLVSFSLGENFENLVLTGPAEPGGILVGNGNALGNSITGSTLDQNHLFGGEGDDTLIGGNVFDRLSGNAGDDSIDAGAGDDSLFGGLGADTLLAGDGNDLLIGWQDTSSTSNTDGGNFLSGGSGNDTLQGGGGGNETLYGGLGSDILNGGCRDTEQTEPTGNPDLFVFRSVEESRSGLGLRDTITSFETGFSQIDLSEFVQSGVRIDLAITSFTYETVVQISDDEEAPVVTTVVRPVATTFYHNVSGFEQSHTADIILHVDSNSGTKFLVASTYEEYRGQGAIDEALDTDFEVEIFTDTLLVREDFLLASDIVLS